MNKQCFVIMNIGYDSKVSRLFFSKKGGMRELVPPGGGSSEGSIRTKGRCSSCLRNPGDCASLAASVRAIDLGQKV